MITALLEKIPLLIIALLFLTAIVIIYFRSRNITRSECVQIFKTAKYLNLWVVILTLIFTGVFGVINHVKLRKSVNAIISLNYSEASQAQNSNGTRYNMAEIICDEVIERAMKKGALEDVTVKQLKNCLSVYPCVQGGVADESEYHISTEFAIKYHASRHTDHLNSENVIKLITSAYKDYYIEKYTDNFRLDTQNEEPAFEKMEYMDIVAYFEKETQSVLNYMYAMAEKNPSFVTSNDSTFNSIAGKIYQFKKTQINENLKALILQNGISRDKAEYIERLTYQNMNIDIERQKNFASFDVCNRAVEGYYEEMTRVVLVPTWDQSGKYYMGRTKVGIDELSVQAADFSDKVASDEKRIMDNKLLIQKMDVEKADESIYKYADELIAGMYQTIKDFEKEAILAGREYYDYKMNQCIAVRIYSVSLMNELKLLIIYAGLSYITLMLYYIAGKFPKRHKTL